MSFARPAALLVCVLACDAGWSADKAVLCHVEGRVTNASAGTPLKKVILRLKRLEQNPGVNLQPSVATYTTTSDGNGKFQFEEVEPGAYWLTGERTGFLEQSYGASVPMVRGTPVKLFAGQEAKDLVLKMTSQAFIYGKVGDEDGDAVPNAQVTILKSAYLRGRRVLQLVNQTSSQDDGSFVIGNLTPGRYYVSASDTRQPESMGPNGSRPPREAYTLTYYPGVADAAGAAPVEVAPGGEVRGVEIRLRKEGIFQIRGKAIDTSTGKPAQNFALQMAPLDEGGAFAEQRNVGAVVGRDGAFEFQNVPPGTYAIQSGSGDVTFYTVEGDGGGSITRTLRVTGSAPEPDGAAKNRAPLVGRVVVHVADHDLDNLVLPLGGGAEIAGSIRMEDAHSQARPAVILSPNAVSGRFPSVAQSGDDGAFRLQGLLPDTYSLEVKGLPEGSYVKAVRLGGREVDPAAMDITAAGGRLEIVVSPTAGAVSGTVRTAQGDAAAGALVQAWSSGDGRALYGEADENGAFHINGLAPGDYKIIAWEEVDQSLSSDPAFRSHFENQAASVKLGERGRETVEVKLISRDAIEAEAARLR